LSERKQNKKIDKRAPVIVGVGDLVDRSKEDGLNPQELLAKACEHAIQDSGIKELNKHIDYSGSVKELSQLVKQLKTLNKKVNVVQVHH